FDVSGADRIDHSHKYDGHGAGHLLQRARGCACRGQDDVGGERNQFRRVFASAGSVRSPASVDARIAALGPAQLLQRLYERRGASLPFGTVSGKVHEHADATNPIGLLRARRERPRGCRAAKKEGELAPPNHSITSSARASSVGGTCRPSALAVLRLITSSYLVGACTGRSPGFSPFRMRSM